MKVDRLGPGTLSISASVRNSRSLPSVSQQAAQRKIGLPDTLSLAGDRVSVVGGGVVTNRDTGEVRPAEHEPSILRLEGGVAGGGTVRVRWFVRGEGRATVRYSSQKGGSLTKEVKLTE